MAAAFCGLCKGISGPDISSCQEQKKYIRQLRELNARVTFQLENLTLWKKEAKKCLAFASRPAFYSHAHKRCGLERGPAVRASSDASCDDLSVASLNDGLVSKKVGAALQQVAAQLRSSSLSTLDVAGALTLGMANAPSSGTRGAGDEGTKANEAQLMTTGTTLPSSEPDKQSAPLEKVHGQSRPLRGEFGTQQVGPSLDPHVGRSGASEQGARRGNAAQARAPPQPFRRSGPLDRGSSKRAGRHTRPWVRLQGQSGPSDGEAEAGSGEIPPSPPRLRGAAIRSSADATRPSLVLSQEGQKRHDALRQTRQLNQGEEQQQGLEREQQQEHRKQRWRGQPLPSLTAAAEISKRQLAGMELVAAATRAGLRLDCKGLNMLVVHLGELDSWQGALNAISAFREQGVVPNEFVYTSLFRILGQCKRLSDLQEAFDRMLEDGSDGATAAYNAAISACTKCGDWQAALRIHGTMKQRGEAQHDKGTFRVMADACAAAGRWQQALELVSEAEAARGFRPDVAFYTGVIAACARAKRVKEALAVLDRMEAAGCAADAATYSAAMSACESRGRWEDAMWLHDRMQAAGVLPNVVTWTALISACSAAGKGQLAEETFRQMLAAGCSPNVVTWGALVGAYSRAGDWEGAERAFEQMAAQGDVVPNEVVWAALVSAYEAGAQWDKALEALARMQAAGVAPSRPAWNTAVSACAKTARWQEMGDVLARMQAAGRPLCVVTYSTMIDGYGRRGLWEKASELFDKMLEAGIRPNQVACAALMRAYARGRQYILADTFFQEMHRLHGVVPDKYVYLALLQVCGYRGEWVRAGEVFAGMKRAGCRPDGTIYQALIEVYETNDQWELAMRVLETMEA